MGVHRLSLGENVISAGETLTSSRGEVIAGFLARGDNLRKRGALAPALLLRGRILNEFLNLLKAFGVLHRC